MKQEPSDYNDFAKQEFSFTAAYYKNRFMKGKPQPSKPEETQTELVSKDDFDMMIKCKSTKIY